MDMHHESCFMQNLINTKHSRQLLDIKINAKGSRGILHHSFAPIILTKRSFTEVRMLNRMQEDRLETVAKFGPFPPLQPLPSRICSDSPLWPASG